jgi:hypothetical protein
MRETLKRSNNFSKRFKKYRKTKHRAGGCEEQRCPHRQIGKIVNAPQPFVRKERSGKAQQHECQKHNGCYFLNT